MTGAWLVSYVALWFVVLGLVAVCVGLLQEVGTLRRASSGTAATPAINILPEAAGPIIGSVLPEAEFETVNGHGTMGLALPGRRGSTLIVFMSALCGGCQSVVTPVNSLARRVPPDFLIVAVMRSDADLCDTFLRLYPLQIPVVLDAGGTLSTAFAVQNAPFGLLYDERRLLVRKGWVELQPDLDALLGDSTAPSRSLNRVYPRPGADEAGRIESVSLHVQR